MNIAIVFPDENIFEYIWAIHLNTTLLLILLFPSYLDWCPFEKKQSIWDCLSFNLQETGRCPR